MEQNEYQPTQFYAEQLNLSDKTIRRMLPQVSEILAVHGGVLKKKPGRGIRLDMKNEDKKKLLDEMNRMDFSEENERGGPWDQKARRIDMLLNLLLYSDEMISLSGIAYKYYVSRGTASNDLKALEPFTQKHGLSILRTNKGTGIWGKEQNLRNCLTDLIVYILENNREANISAIQQETTMTILDVFSPDDISFAEESLKYMEHSAGYCFDDQEYLRISVQILIQICRIRNGFFIDTMPGSSGNEDPLRDLALELASMLHETYGFPVSNPEVENMRSLLAETSLSRCFANRRLPGKERREKAVAFSEDFIDAFSVITGINLRMKSAFYINVISHITLMLERTVGNVPAKNPVIEVLLDNYKGTINVCQIICWILSRKFNLPDICFDEICYLMLYIQGELLENQEKANVLLVSNVSNSIVSIAKHKIAQKYPGWRLRVCSPGELQGLPQNDYDYILSMGTIGEKKVCIPCISVTPLMDERDFAHIRSVLAVLHSSEELYFRELMQAVNDLKDIGCSVKICDGSRNDRGKGECLKIKTLKGIRFAYKWNAEGKNSVIFQINHGNKKLERVLIYMSNWDYMLFASKMVYLMDNCPNGVMKKFADYILGEEKEYV